MLIPSLSAALASAFQSFSLPDEIDWMALVKRTGQSFTLLNAMGNTPYFFEKSNEIATSPTEAIVLPCTSEYEIWLKTMSLTSIAPLHHLQEFLHRLQFIFHSNNHLKRLSDEHFLYEKTSKFYKNILSTRKSEVLQTTADLFAELLDFKRVALFAYSQKQQTFHGVVGHNLKNDLIKQISEPWSNIPFAPLILATVMPAFMPEVSGSNGLPERYVDQFGLTSLVVVPLTANNQFIGAALLDHGGDFFEPSGEVLQACMQFGTHIGGIIHQHTTEIGSHFSWRVDRPLSPREIEVIQLAALGESTKEIAADLGLSDYTVRDYLTSAVEKLNARNRTEAVAIAMRMGIIH
ncbi:LuxR C-terminal-related transcriptional regulator [Effusibacillus consociatus]|uniref:LuxR C-terminal-related transcriptional regulator n=1 Tax=Effusibacillus consociatus TaxID=1117041 RepID=A0ABV9Q0H9_9BACL